MRFSRRSLLENNQRQVTGPIAGRSSPITAVSKIPNAPIAAVSSLTLAKERMRLTKKDKLSAKEQEDLNNLETADAFTSATPGIGANVSISDIATRTFLTPVLSDVIPNFEMNLAQPPKIWYELYRDIYYHDSVGGAAVDIISSLAFSDFNLIGLDDKQLEPFMRSIDRLKARRMFPHTSIEYNVNGAFIAQSKWDADQKGFKNLIPHNPAFATIMSSPIFGKDPEVTIDFSGALTEIGALNKKNKKAVVGLDNDMINSQYTIPDAELIYMIRRGQIRDIRGVSYFKRMLPIWLFEKALMRGTLDQATKRQRALAHIQVGDESWIPTAEEMQMLGQLYSNADLDPTGAAFITRLGVNVNDIKRADDFWKWNDISDWANTNKMKALGINEGLLSGDLTLNTLDMSLSVFIEQVRDHRDTLTYETFYERMFPRISFENNIVLKKGQQNLETADVTKELTFIPQSAYETAATKVEAFDPRKHAMPRVAWHKRLRPEADQTYLEVLSTLEEKGLPLPLQMWASAGGLEINQLMNGLEADGQLRDKIKEWKADHAAQADENVEESSVQPTANLQKVGLLNRDYSKLIDTLGPRNLTSDGKRHLLTAKGRKVLTEKIHKGIAEALSEIGKRDNAKRRELASKQDRKTSIVVNK